MTATARAILAGPGAARALGAGGEGHLEVALGAGGYVRLGTDSWLLLTEPHSQPGPLSLHVAALGARSAEAGWPARVEPGALTVGPRRIALAGVALTLSPRPPGRQRMLDRALAAARASCPAAPPILGPGIAALERGDGSRAVVLLAGRGEGLTPAGDDVLAGYAAWAATAGAPPALAALAAERASPIGLAYLRCAERGELPGPAARLLAAVLTGDPAAASRRARTLRLWGSTSGVALLWGMAAGRRAELSSGKSVTARTSGRSRPT